LSAATGSVSAKMPSLKRTPAPESEERDRKTYVGEDINALYDSRATGK